MCTSGTAVANLHPGRARGGARRRPARRRHRRPAGPAARHRRQPDHRPGRHLRSPGRDRRRGDPRRDPRSRRRAPTSCTSTCSSTTRSSPTTGGTRSRSRSSPPAVRSSSPRCGELLEVGPRTVVVAGDDAGPPARILAEYAHWPLLAEPSSGSRTGENAIRCYRLLLDGDLGRRVERAVVFGHPTLSRPVMQLLARDDVEVLDAGSRARGVWTERPFTVARRFMSGQPTAGGRRRPGLARGVADRRRRGRARAGCPARRRGHHAVRRRRGGQPIPATRRPAGRRCVQPDPRPRPDGREVRGRRPAQGDRQPRPLRHRRHRLVRDRRRARPVHIEPGDRADGRRDVPARRERARASAPTSPVPT